MMTTTSILILKIMVGDADGDCDCFRRIDCPGDGYDDVAGDFDDEHGDFFWYLARDLVIIFAKVLHLYIHCIVADVARLLQSCNALFDGDCNIAM